MSTGAIKGAEVDFQAPKCSLNGLAGVDTNLREDESAEFKNIYSLLHLECHLISISNLNLLGLFSIERGKRDLEN